MKVVCEKCESSFKFEAIKDMKCCPVCGEPFGDEEESVEINLSEKEQDLLYFDEINIDEEEPEYSDVEVYCKQCGKIDLLDLELFDKLVDGKYVKLKKGIIIKCKNCGKEHKPRKILYKRKDHYAPPLPHCPACNSVMLKKITKGSKFLAAATIGTFALPYNSKTFECKDCGYRF